MFHKSLYSVENREGKKEELEQIDPEENILVDTT